MPSDDVRQNIIKSMRLPTIYRDLDLPWQPRDSHERGSLYLQQGMMQLEMDNEVKRTQAALSMPQTSDGSSKQTNLLQPCPVFHPFRQSGFQSEIDSQNKVLLFLSTKLNPIDYTCLRLVNKLTYRRMPSWYPKSSNLLEIGDPDGMHPILNLTSCRHCVPVLHFPAHCQLHFHLRTFMPEHLTYCAKCSKYTNAAVPDAKMGDTRRCGICFVDYRRMYSRGRRRLEQVRDGVRLMKYYRDGYEDMPKAEERPWERELSLGREQREDSESSDFLDLTLDERPGDEDVSQLTTVEFQQRLLSHIRVIGQSLW